MANLNVVPSGWQELKIDKLSSKVGSGVTPRGGSAAYSISGIKFIRSQNVHFSGLKLNDVVYISQEIHKSMSGSQLNDRDVLLNITGASIGRCTFVPKDFGEANVNQHVCIIRPNEKIESAYLSQWFASDEGQHAIMTYQAGGNREGLNFQQIRSMTVTHPPLPEQQKIAAILTSVDEVIEKTQAQIDKLKDLKTAMMQELLSPREDSSQGNGVGTKQASADAALNNSTACRESYIPHTEFKDSPVGRIPKSWEVLPLSKVAKLERGKFSHRPRNDPAFYNGDIPFLQTGDIPKKSPYITKFSQTLNEKGLSVSKSFPIGTLVITIAATIGEIGILEFESCFPDSLVGITVNSTKADPMYILYVMRHLKGELDLLAPQTAQKNINLDILNPFIIPVPPLLEQKKISTSLESIDGSLNMLDRKLSKIQNTKKALMQDLLTGKVRVKLEASR